MKKTEWRGQDCPPLYEMHRNGGMMQMTIYANVHQEEPADKDGSESQTEGDWIADALTLPVGVMDYGSIVSALIDAKYPHDKMDAINNNHNAALSRAIEKLGIHEEIDEILDNEDVEKWRDMQSYREESKMVARAIVEMVTMDTEESGVSDGQE